MEQQSDHNASFALLTPEARDTYKSATAWASRRQELPKITAFRLEDGNDNMQNAVVEHVPGLDAFRGLSPGSETQRWVGKKFEGGWLLEADPATDPILPPDETVIPTATAWVKAVQACDKAKADQLQAVTNLISNVTPTLCGAGGAVSVSDVQKLADGPNSTDIVAQYSSDALIWARTVAVTSPSTFHVVVAPIGTEWRVLGLY